MWEDDELCILWSSPVLQIFEICNEFRRVKVLVLRKNYNDASGERVKE